MRNLERQIWKLESKVERKIVFRDDLIRRRQQRRLMPGVQAPTTKREPGTFEAKHYSDIHRRQLADTLPTHPIFFERRGSPRLYDIPMYDSNRNGTYHFPYQDRYGRQYPAMYSGPPRSVGRFQSPPRSPRMLDSWEPTYERYSGIKRRRSPSADREFERAERRGKRMARGH